ncbi:MAG TPA: carboxypeptidase regulatory-like domain-containing protein [Jatrophihabitantaceae bacterium]|nr:carboxypeptidase regulatory-like domain-containing protein [Jatrophihabitantaceae bacterium]
MFRLRPLVVAAASASVLAMLVGVADAANSPLPRPRPVRHVRVAPRSLTSVRLAWTNPTSASFRATVVRMARGTIAPHGPAQGRGIAAVGRSRHSVVARGLAPGGSYAFALYATDGHGHFARRAVAHVVMGPAPVRDLETFVSGRDISLDWTNPTTISFTGVTARYAKGPTAPRAGHGKPIALSSATASSVTLTHLAKDTTYSVSVWAHDAHRRRSPVRTVSFTTDATRSVPKNGTYTGRVTDTDGDALANVTLSLNNFDADTTTLTTTGPDGRFAVVLPPAEYIIDFDGSQATGGSSDSVGYVGHSTIVKISAGRATHQAELALHRGAVVTGRVTDTHGDPLGGVRAYLADVYPYLPAENNTSFSVFYESGPFPSAITAADGTYTLKGTPTMALRACSDPTGGRVSGGASATARYLDACTSESVDPAPGSTIAVPDMQLGSAPGGEVSGTVVSPSGVGIAGVDVDVSTSNGFFGAAQRTAADGSYDIRGLAAGTYQVCFDAEFVMDDSPTGYLSKCRAAKITVAAGQHAHVDGRLHPAAAVTGTVTDASGRPLAGVQISIEPPHAFSSAFFGLGVTDAHGQYLFKGLKAGRFRACFDTEAVTPTRPTPGAAPGCRHGLFSTRIGAVRTGIDASLAVSGAISGTVTYSDGSPVRDADIDIEPLTNAAEDFFGFAETNTHGRYALRGMPAGKYRVCFELSNPAGPDREFCDHDRVSVRLGRFTRHVDDKLPEMARLTVSVHDSGGHPIAGADVAVLARCKRDQGFDCDHVSSLASSVPVTVRASAAADAHGSVEFTLLPPGTYAVCAFGFFGATTGAIPPAGYADRCTGDSFDIDATGGSTHAVTLTLPDAGAAEGKITDGTGHPLRGVLVHVSNSAADDFQSEYDGENPDDPSEYSVTAADGSYRVRSIAPGDQTVCVDAANAKGGTSAAGYVDQCLGAAPGTTAGGTTIAVTADQITLAPDLALAAGAGVSGTVTSTNSDHVRFAAVAVFNGKGTEVGSGQANRNGRYTVTRLPAVKSTICFETEAVLRCYQNAAWKGGPPPAGATPVTLTAGTITSGIDIRLKT